jgi:methyl-accepting chemotaxis protein
MDVLKLSQKQKMVIFIGTLCLGFLVMGWFSAKKLSTMTLQYERSSKIYQGVATLSATQAKLLSLAADRDTTRMKDVPQMLEKLKEISGDIAKDVTFLQTMGFAQDSSAISHAIAGFEKAMGPWLKMKSELGFSVNEGKLGTLTQLAAQIEAKIETTGMVTIRSDFQAMIKTQKNYLLAPNEKNFKLFNRAMATFINTSKLYSALSGYQQEVDRFKQAFVRVSELSQQVGQYESQLSASEDAARNSIHTATEKLLAVSHTFQKKARHEAEQTQWSVLTACALLAAMTITIFVMFSLSLTRSLSQIKVVLDSLSRGDLSQRLPVSNNLRDEFNLLAIAINESCEQLGMLVQKVQNNSRALSGDAGNLHQSIDHLVAAQKEAMNETEMLASATEEVSITTQDVSHSLEFVADVSQAATSAAQEGGKVIETAIQSLADVGHILTSAAEHTHLLEQASEKVDSVMEIINGIAEQTNLLALNAAIEAARAGEQGRGFAVVADEVRNLSVRTVDAVSDITQTIETMKHESAEVIQYITQSRESMSVGQKQGKEAIQALSHITDKTGEAAHQTDVIFVSIKELVTTSQSMADSMNQISESMKELESSNMQLRATSETVEQRSGELAQDCLHFTI